jgi:hypothetical protein
VGEFGEQDGPGAACQHRTVNLPVHETPGTEPVVEFAQQGAGRSEGVAGGLKGGANGFEAVAGRSEAVAGRSEAVAGRSEAVVVLSEAVVCASEGVASHSEGVAGPSAASCPAVFRRGAGV